MLCQLFILAITLLSVYLLYTSHTFVFYVKYIYYLGTGFMSAFVLTPLVALRPRDIRNLELVATIWTLMWKPLNVDVELRNEGNVVSDSPCVFVSNHQSALDVLVYLSHFPKRCSILCKKELLYMGAFGLGAWLCELVFIDRLNPEKARSTMAETVKTILGRNLKLWVFPEGTRNTKPEMLPFKKGAFHLAVQAQVPIVPLVISSYRHFLSPKLKYWIKGRVIIHAMDPIPTEGLTAEDVNSLVERIQNQMQQQLNITTKEAEDQARRAGNDALLKILDKEQ